MVRIIAIFISKRFLFLIFISGNVDDDLMFEYGEGTDTYQGCGATLMGEMWYFGGYYTSQRRQV